jgi:hypothetical protein
MSALKAESALSRDRLVSGLEQAELSLNLKRRVGRAVGAHPVKTIVIASAVGLTLAKLIPLAFRIGSTSFGARVAKLAISAGLPLLTEYLGRNRRA